MKLLKAIKNLKLCHRYPFLRPRRLWDGKVIPIWTWKAQWTWLDSFPDGWHKFILSQLEEVRKVLIEYGELKNFRILDAKEKYGEARIYWTGVLEKACYDKVNDILIQMEIDSWNFCSSCGEYATMESKGYILPFCPECAKQAKQKGIKCVAKKD